MKTASTRKKEPRSWPVTIIAGGIALASLAVAAVLFKTQLPDVLAALAFFFFAVLVAIVAVQGRRGALRELIHSAVHLP